MIPKEEAKELVRKFETVSTMCNTRELDEEDAIKCAIICVDEKIELIRHWGNVELIVNHLNEVKQELNNFQ